MNVEVKAVSSFTHYRWNANVGDTNKVPKPEATELEKAGLVEIVGEGQPEQETKMDDVLENKMAEAPANKSRTKKAG